MIFSLIQDFDDMLAAMPTEHPLVRILRLLEEAIRRDIHFIARHPTTMFQCLWNSAWWYDCPEVAKHYEEPEGGWLSEGPPWGRSGPKLYERMEEWRREKEQTPGFCWARALRPPYDPLGSARRGMLVGHEGGVTDLALSPDRRIVASASSDGTVRLWEIDTGREVGRLDAGGPVSAVAFSPDGLRLATGSEEPGQTVRIWDARQGVPVVTIRTPPEVRDADRRDLRERFAEHERQGMAKLAEDDARSANCLAFSPDGRLLATAGHLSAVSLWDSRTGAHLHRLGRLEWNSCSAPRKLGAVVREG